MVAEGRWDEIVGLGADALWAVEIALMDPGLNKNATQAMREIAAIMRLPGPGAIEKRARELAKESDIASQAMASVKALGGLRQAAADLANNFEPDANYLAIALYRVNKFTSQDLPPLVAANAEQIRDAYYAYKIDRITRKKAQTKVSQGLLYFVRCGRSILVSIVRSWNLSLRIDCQRL